MRNLKKFLALVLAMMMVMSLMLTVNATSFEDDDKVETKFAEAVDVLTGIGIIKGFDNDGVTTFDPQGKVTRAQMAAFVYRIATNDAEEKQAHLYAGSGTRFTDVAEGAWYDGVVGYCADREIIVGYGDGTFRPWQEVTGTEALVMILRAVGYDQGKEFQGSAWAVNAYSRANDLKLLVNVDNTNYKSTLSDVATRELVAELLFQAGRKPTVTWTQALGYNDGSSTLLGPGTPNKSLLVKNYGLASMTGIIVGNQATGEKVTKLGVELSLTKEAGKITGTTASGVSYLTATSTDDLTAETKANASISFNLKTGLDQFGHKVDVWYKDGTNDPTKPLQVGEDAAGTKGTAIDDVYGTVYCARSLGTTSAVVYSDGVDLEVTATDTDLGKAIDNAGFTIGDKVNVSDGFDPIIEADKGDDVPVTHGDSDLYLLVSNGGGKLDLIVSMSIGVWDVQAVNNYSKPKSVTIDAGKDLTTASSDVTIQRSVKSTPVNTDHILVYGEDAISVGATMVVNKIYGTNRTKATGSVANVDMDAAAFFYGLDKITEEKTGTITAINGGKVTIRTDDGVETIEQSPLWNLAAANTIYNGSNALLLIGNTLTFVLDGNGEYLGVSKASNEPIMGAYGYWTQTGISGIKYFIQGVTRDGTVMNEEIDLATYQALFTTPAGDGEDANRNNKLPFLATKVGGDSSTSLTVVPKATASIGYDDYIVGEDKTTTSGSAGWEEFATDNNAKTTLVKGQTSFIESVGGVANTKVFLTDQTVYHVVTGYGDDLKVEHFTGLDDLLQGHDSISFNGYYFLAEDDTEHAVSMNNIVEEALLVNVKRVSPSSFYFNKDQSAATNSIDEKTADGKAVQLEMYEAGKNEAGSILVSMLDLSAGAGSKSTTGNAQQTTANKFYLASTDSSGYLELVEQKEGAKGYVYYSNGSNGELVNAGTAFGEISFLNESNDTVTLNAKDATVIDVATGAKDRGITDYASLRTAAEENKLEVAVLLTAAGGDTAAVIYVYNCTAR